MIDLRDKAWVVFGRRGLGKSVLLKHILSKTPDHLLYDPLGEHEGFRRYIPEDRKSVEELSRFIEKVVLKERPSMFVVDECNRYVPPKPAPLPAGIDDLNDFARHYGISMGYVARRPVQFHTDIVELADYIFVFNLNGRNDHRYLEDLHRGFGDAVRGLAKHQFAILAQGSEIIIHAPVAFTDLGQYTDPESE